MTTPETSAPAPTPEKASYWEDFIDILYAPSQVFARRENGNPWIPILVITLVLGLLWLASARVLEPVFDAEFDRQMQRTLAANPNMSAEQLEAGRALVQRFQLIGAFFIIPISLAVIGLALWVVGKVLESKQTVRSALVVAALAYTPRIIEQAVGLAEGLIRDVSAIDGRNRLTWGIGRFLDPDTVNAGLIAMLSRIDVFTIWVTVLLAIGLAVTGKISRERAAVGGVIMWLVGAVPTFLAAARG